MNTIPIFSLTRISFEGANFNKVFLIIININTSIKGDNKTIKLKGYNRAVVREHKTSGSLNFVAKEEMSHLIQVVQK